MSLTTRFPGEVIIADSPENVVFGTCMLGSTYGSVESASVKRNADLEEIKKCGGALLAAIAHNAHFELTMECLYTADVDPPGIGDLITFPIAGVQGRVLPGAEIKWEKAGQRMLSITAKSWDALSTNSGAGAAKSYDGTTYTDLDV